MRSVLVFVSPIDNRLNSGAACEDALLSGGRRTSRRNRKKIEGLGWGPLIV